MMIHSELLAIGEVEVTGLTKCIINITSARLDFHLTAAAWININPSSHEIHILARHILGVHTIAPPTRLLYSLG